MSGEPSPPPNSPQEPERGGLFRRRVALQSAKEALQPEAAPAPPPAGKPHSQRRPALSAISGFFSFLLVLALCLAGVAGYAQHQMSEPGPLEADKIVLIAPRTEAPDILGQLENEGVIDSSLTLNAALVISGDRKKLKAGEYLFKAHASLRDVIETLVSGHEILHSITIPEGLTSQQIVERLRDSDILSGDVMDIPKEGSLLPETYRVSRGMQRASLIRLMQDDQKKALEQIWSRRSPDLPLRSSFELLTLASIVEKETGKADERPRVAGVFINRLRSHIKLQSDPTIVYGLVFGQGTLGRGISRAEVDKPTPYNTYAIEGLPPGPISNPGRAAMEAVANPSRTKDIYFVADGTGGHAFAETLDQHNKNVIRWRQIEKDRAASVDRAPPPPAPATPTLLRDQRGQVSDTNVPLFGALSPAFQRNDSDLLAFAAPAGQMTTPASAAIDGARQRAAQPAAPLPTAKDDNAKAAGPSPKYSLAGKLDDSVAAQLGLADAPVAAGGDEVEAIDTGAYPEPAARRADQKARAARYGAPSGGDTLPDQVVAELTPSGGASSTEAPAGPRIIRIYDASEGTALDPLKDKSWDLNSAKTVPVMAQDTPPAAKRPNPQAKARHNAPATQQ